MRQQSPRLIIDIYVPLLFAFGTHKDASEPPTQYFFDDYVWNNENICTDLALGFVCMNNYDYILGLRGYMANCPLLILGGIKSTPSYEIYSLNLLWKRQEYFIKAHLQTSLSLEEIKNKKIKK